MPIYEFLCDRCGRFEEWRRLAASGEPASCPTCGAPAPRAFSPPGLIGAASRVGPPRAPAGPGPEPRLVRRAGGEALAAPAGRPRVASGRPWQLAH